MITFNIRAANGNYYRGHEPANSHSNCWCSCSDSTKHALVFTIEQARDLVKAWSGYLNIVISASAIPMAGEEFQHELFCAKGGSWYEYEKSKEIQSKD